MQECLLKKSEALKLTNEAWRSKNVPLDELVKNYGDYYKFKQSKGAEKMNVIETATKEMNKWKKLLSIYPPRCSTASPSWRKV